jgi:hypothetical protein
LAHIAAIAIPLSFHLVLQPPAFNAEPSVTDFYIGLISATIREFLKIWPILMLRSLCG